VKEDQRDQRDQRGQRTVESCQPAPSLSSSAPSSSSSPQPASVAPVKAEPAKGGDRAVAPPPGFENVVPALASAPSQPVRRPPPGFEDFKREPPPPDRGPSPGSGGKGKQKETEKEKEKQPRQPRSDIKSRAPAGFGQLTRTESVETSAKGGLPQPAAPEKPESDDSGEDSDSSPAAAQEKPKMDPATMKRNQELLQKLRLIFKGDTDKIDHFRTLSQGFRSGEISAPSYYEQYLQMLGPHANKIFQELVDLLPEEDKKVALLAAKSDRKAAVCPFSFPACLVSVSHFFFSFPR